MFDPLNPSSAFGSDLYYKIHATSLTNTGLCFTTLFISPLPSCPRCLNNRCPLTLYWPGESCSFLSASPRMERDSGRHSIPFIGPQRAGDTFGFWNATSALLNRCKIMSPRFERGVLGESRMLRSYVWNGRTTDKSWAQGAPCCWILTSLLLFSSVANLFHPRRIIRTETRCKILVLCLKVSYKVLIGM